MSTPELSWGVCDEAMPTTISAMSRDLFLEIRGPGASVLSVLGLGMPVCSGSVHARNRAIRCQHRLRAHGENVLNGQLLARALVPPPSAGTAQRNRRAAALAA